MSDHKPVTAEELAEIERLDREATPGPWAYDEEDAVIETARGSSVAILTRAARPGLTHVNPDGRAIVTYRSAAPRLARDLANARHDLDTERKASAMLGDRCLDLGRELEALRAAVRAHEAAVRASGPDTAACKWFDGIKLVDEAFPIEALVPIVDAPSYPDPHGLDRS